LRRRGVRRGRRLRPARCRQRQREDQRDQSQRISGGGTGPCSVRPR
jgi:hypothetical protein